MWPPPPGELVRARIMSRTGNDPAALLGVILGFFGGELLLLCLKNRPQKGRQGRTNNKRFRGHRDLTRGKDYTMNEKIIKRIANLLSVKSIVTITPHGGFLPTSPLRTKSRRTL